MWVLAVSVQFVLQPHTIYANHELNKLKACSFFTKKKPKNKNYYPQVSSLSILFLLGRVRERNGQRFSEAVWARLKPGA